MVVLHLFDTKTTATDAKVYMGKKLTIREVVVSQIPLITIGRNNLIILAVVIMYSKI